ERGCMARNAGLVVLDEVVARVAGWPIEALEPFAAPALAAAARAMDVEEAAVASDADELIAAVHEAVPRVGDRRARAWLLAVKRTIHGNATAAWVDPPLALCPSIEYGAPSLLKTLAAACAARRELATRVRAFATSVDAELDAQRAALGDI